MPASRARRVRLPTNAVRIIAGQWRGRRLPVANAAGLRPSPVRARETLFNWLAPIIAGARCLDLFAGTGALGLEALSRGAADVCFVERDPAVADNLRALLTTLGASDRALVLQADAVHAPLDGRRGSTTADIVFIDPPFEACLHAAALRAVADRLAPQSLVYVEFPVAEASTIDAALAPDFAVVRRNRAGQVAFCLARPAFAGEDSAP